MHLHRNQSTRWLSTSLPLAVALVCLADCASTKQPSRIAPLGKEVKGAGFLGDLFPSRING